MTPNIDDVQTIEDLRNFVHRTLCEKESLLPEQFHVTEMQLMRRGRSCGLQYSLHGPRSVRLGAVWASDQNVLYLYDTRGVRYARVPLPRRVVSDRVAA